MGKTGKNKHGIMCVYCGERPSTPGKGDHAVANALFTNPRPSDMVTVPACRRCNEGKGPFDTYLRDSLVIDMATARNRSAQELLKGKVARSFRTNRTEFNAAALASARRVPAFTPAGIYVEDVLSIPLDDRKIRRALRFMVKGLFYWVKDERIPNDYQFEFDRLRGDGIGNVWDKMASKSDGAGSATSFL